MLGKPCTLSSLMTEMWKTEVFKIYFFIFDENAMGDFFYINCKVLNKTAYLLFLTLQYLDQNLKKSLFKNIFMFLSWDCAGCERRQKYFLIK